MRPRGERCSPSLELAMGVESDVAVGVPVFRFDSGGTTGCGGGALDGGGAGACFARAVANVVPPVFFDGTGGTALGSCVGPDDSE